MANKPSKLSAFAAAALSGLVALAPAAQAESLTPEQIEAGWTEEAWDLHQASKSASHYVETTDNAVGIVLHVGQDLRDRAQAASEKHDVPVEHALNVMINRIAEHYAESFERFGLTTEMHPSSMNARATGITYVLRAYTSDNEITSINYEGTRGSPTLDLGEADNEMPRVAQAVTYLNRRASLENVSPAPQIGG